MVKAERAPDDTKAHLTTYFLRDHYGNTTNVISEDDFGNHREACVTFEPTGTFPWATRNAEGHTEFSVYNRALGVQTAARDPNGLVTKAKVDTFGQSLEAIAPDGVTTKITRSREKTNRWITRIKHVTPGHGESEDVADSFGRVVLKAHAVDWKHSN